MENSNFMDVLNRKKYSQWTSPITGEPAYVGDSTPKPSALDNYKRAIVEQPMSANEPKPSMFRKILARIAGGSGEPNARFDVEHPDYTRKMREWNERTGMLGKVVGIESTENINRARIGELGTRSSANTARAGYYGRGNREYQPETKQDILDIEAAKHPVNTRPIQGHVISRGIGGGKFHNILVDPTTGEDMQDLGEGRPFQSPMSFAEFKQRADYSAGLKGTSELSPSAEKAVRDNEAYGTIDELKIPNAAYDSTQKRFFITDPSGKFINPRTPEEVTALQRLTLRHQLRVQQKLASGAGSQSYPVPQGTNIPAEPEMEIIETDENGNPIEE